MKIPPYIVDNPPRSLYRAAEGANYSLLKHFARSPYHVLAEMTKVPEPPSPAILKGLAIEQLTLLGDLDPEILVVSPFDDYRTKEAREWRDAQIEAGRSVISSEVLAECQMAAKNVHSHPVAGPMLRDCRVQVMASDVYTFECMSTVTRKCLIDGVGVASNVLVDLKSTVDASPNAWRRRAAQFFYHVQAAYYTDIWVSATQSSAEEPPTFVFVCVESEAPFAVGCYVLDSEARATGDALWKSWLKRWSDCKKSGHWPGYTDVCPGYVSLPKYAISDMPL